MLDLTARHADAWNAAWFGLPDERLAGRRADLAAACARVGRDPATLTITVGIEVRYPDADGAPAPDPDDESPFLTGTPDEIAAGLRAHADGRCGPRHRRPHAVHARDRRDVRRGGRRCSAQSPGPLAA